jgi:hypothetical protein
VHSHARPYLPRHHVKLSDFHLPPGSIDAHSILIYYQPKTDTAFTINYHRPMTTRDLTGLALTRSERIVVIALSYIFVAPVIFANGKRLLFYLRAISQEARRQLNEEDRRAGV